MASLKDFDINNISPDMINRARRLLDTPKGREVMKSLQNTENIQNMIQNLQGEKVESKKGILIRPNGIIKLKIINNVPLEGTDVQFVIIKLKNQNITAWYDANNKNINKKASKLLNISVGGMVVLCGEEDITLDILN
jgi:hypothetical protein